MKVLLVVLALAMLAGNAVAAAPTADERPDVVIVLLDDMREEDWLGLPRTRRLIAQKGSWFPNFFSVTPLCCPARVELLTGMYAHNSGIKDNHGPNGGYGAFNRNGLADKTIGKVLGPTYRVGLFGKFLNGYDGVRAVMPGFDVWWATSGQQFNDYPVNHNGKISMEDGYHTTELRRRVRGFLQGRGATFAYVSVLAPHHPSVPDKRDRRAFRGVVRERTPALNEADVSDKPAYVRNATPERLRRLDTMNRNRLRSLLAADRAIASIHNRLAKRGRPFYLFVLSDNGYMLGEHRLMHKAAPYDASTRIPMGVIGPGFAPGSIDGRLVGMIDIAPTIAEVAGVELPWADGYSLLSDHDRDVILLEGWATAYGNGDWTALRGQDFVYIENDSGEREYYDYGDDPYELENLLADWNGHEPRLDPAEAQRLADDLARHADCAGRDCP